MISRTTRRSSSLTPVSSRAGFRAESPKLLGIINKGIINAGESLSASNYSSTSYTTQESDTLQFLFRNRTAIAATLIGMLSVGIVLLIWALVRARTERKKADAANAAKTAFLTRISHDIRTPLNGILGLIEIEELKEGDIKVARESRAKARVAANHLLSLINDILEMGKIEDRKLTLEHAPFNLKELCDNTLVLCKLRASSNGITMQDNSPVRHRAVHDRQSHPYPTDHDQPVRQQH